MEMKISRLIDLSVYYYLKGSLYSNATGETLTPIDAKNFTSKRRHWVPSRPVNIYRNGVLVPDLLYKVYYETDVAGGVARVSFNEPVLSTDEISADFSYNYVRIADAFPEEEIGYPVLVVATGVTRGLPFELGGPPEIVTSLYLDLFAQGEGQRDDMADAIREALDAGCPLIDFNLGFPLLPDGTMNPSHDATSQVVGSLEFEDITVRRNPLGMFTPPEVYRAQIAADIRAART